MTFEEQLVHCLKVRFGLAPLEPNTEQLQKIKSAIEARARTGTRPTHNDWRDAVASACPSFGTHFYKGHDNSDLNTLLALAIEAAGRKE